MDKLYWGAVVIFAIGWYIEQRMYVDGYTRRKRDPYKPIDYLGLFSIGEFVGYLIRCLIAPAFVWFSDILIGLPDNLIQAIAAVWLVVMSIFVPAVVERVMMGSNLTYCNASTKIQNAHIHRTKDRWVCAFYGLIEYILPLR